MLKVLVVEDEEEIRELIVFAIESRTKAEIVESFSGNDAIRKLAKSSDFQVDLIISDYKMPDGNGGEIYKYLLENNLNIPFVLCSSDSPRSFPEFAGKEIFGNIIKPEIDSGIKLILSKLKIESSSEVLKYIPAGQSLFKNLKDFPVDVYVKLSKDKYVKVFKRNDRFEEVNFLRYKKRGVRYLYISMDQSGVLINAIQKELKDIISSTGITTAKKVNTVFEIAHATVRAYGFSDEVMELAKESILQTVRFIKREIGIACAIANKLNFKSESTEYKLTFAAFMHDITINHEELIKIQTLDELEEKKNLFARVDIDNFKKHPIEASNLLINMRNIPPDIDRIVIEHHELPDGSGFPKKITHTRISLLTAIFIISHLLADEIYRKKRKININEYVDKISGNYDRGNFVEVIKAVKILNLFR